MFHVTVVPRVGFRVFGRKAEWTNEEFGDGQNMKWNVKKNYVFNLKRKMIIIFLDFNYS